MSAKQPMPGSGTFQWNTGGWFGSQVGGTVWLLVGAATLVVQAPLLAVWWVVCFALVNAVGTGLWLRRDRLRPYPAIQALLALCGLAGLFAVGALGLFGPEQTGRNGSLRSVYGFFLVGVPALMGYFALLERASRKANQSGDS